MPHARSDIDVLLGFAVAPKPTQQLPERAVQLLGPVRVNRSQAITQRLFSIRDITIAFICSREIAVRTFAGWVDLKRRECEVDRLGEPPHFNLQNRQPAHCVQIIREGSEPLLTEIDGDIRPTL